MYKLRKRIASLNEVYYKNHKYGSNQIELNFSLAKLANIINKKEKFYWKNIKRSFWHRF